MAAQLKTSSSKGRRDLVEDRLHQTNPASAAKAGVIRGSLRRGPEQQGVRNGGRRVIGREGGQQRDAPRGKKESGYEFKKWGTSKTRLAKTGPIAARVKGKADEIWAIGDRGLPREA